MACVEQRTYSAVVGTSAPPLTAGCHDDVAAFEEPRVLTTNPWTEWSHTISEMNSTFSSLLANMPVEILLQIFKNLDLQSSARLVMTSRLFAQIYAFNKAAIILPIMQREFSPFGELLQVLAASREDLDTSWGTWLNRRVLYRDTELCAPGVVPRYWLRKPSEEEPPPHMGVHLGHKDLDRLLRLCMTVKGWEEVYPRFRFRDATSRRTLLPHEGERLRSAIYTWMRYSFYFHGELPRPNPWEPSPLSGDPRCNQLRILTNDQLLEVWDLWQTITKCVATTICPSSEYIQEVRIPADRTKWLTGASGTYKSQNYGLSPEEALQFAFGYSQGREGRSNQQVVQTMLKLDPKELLHYLNRRNDYSRESLVRAVRVANPSVEHDQESLSNAILAVAQERRGALAGSDDVVLGADGELAVEANILSRVRKASWEALLYHDHGGILDFEDAELEASRHAHAETAGADLRWHGQYQFLVMRNGRLG